MHPILKTLAKEPEEYEEPALSSRAALALFLTESCAVPSLAAITNTAASQESRSRKELEPDLAHALECSSGATQRKVAVLAGASDHLFAFNSGLVWKKWTDPCAVSSTMMTSTEFFVNNPIQAKLVSEWEGRLSCKGERESANANKPEPKSVSMCRHPSPLSAHSARKCNDKVEEETNDDGGTPRQPSRQYELPGSRSLSRLVPENKTEEYRAYSESAIAELFAVFNRGAQEQLYEPAVKAFQSTAVRIKSVARRAYLSLQERYPFDTLLAELDYGRLWFMDIMRTGRMYHAIVYIGAKVRVYWLGWIQPMMLTGASSVSSSFRECKQVFQELCDGRERQLPLDCLLNSLESSVAPSAPSVPMAAPLNDKDSFYAFLDPCQQRGMFRSFYGRDWQLAPAESCALVRVNSLPSVAHSQESLSLGELCEKDVDSQVGLDYRPWVQTESQQQLLRSEEQLTQESAIEKSREPFTGSSGLKAALNALVSKSNDQIDKVVQYAGDVVNKYAEQSELLRSFQSGLFRFEGPTDEPQSAPAELGEKESAVQAVPVSPVLRQMEKEEEEEQRTSSTGSQRPLEEPHSISSAHDAGVLLSEFELISADDIEEL